MPIWNDSPVPDEAILAPLLRGELDTVSFVRDYVEVRIDYNIVRCMTRPIVRTPNGDFRFPEPGSRDALCGLIDSAVHASGRQRRRHRASHGLRAETRLPLDEASRTLPGGKVSPEAVHFVPADERGRLDVAKMAFW